MNMTPSYVVCGPRGPLVVVYPVRRERRAPVR
jgi:hypothetical protein